MKKTMLMLAALFCLAAQAHAAPVNTYESVVRVTLPVVNASSAVFALQNTSSGVDVLIRRIEISNASTMTVTGGTMQFWVYTSTALTHSASVTSGYNLTTALGSLPSHVTVSTAPLNIQVEGDAAPISGLILATNPPIIRPLYINNDEAATTLLSDAWSENENLGQGDFKEGAQPIILAAGANRAIVIQQKRLGTADFAGGSILVRVTFTTR